MKSMYDTQFFFKKKKIKIKILIEKILIKY